MNILRQVMNILRQAINILRQAINILRQAMIETWIEVIVVSKGHFCSQNFLFKDFSVLLPVILWHGAVD